MLKIEEDGFEDVYDFTVPETSNFFINSILVHNCYEIGMSPILDFENEITGISLCNLTSVNANACRTNGKFDEKKFYRACRDAAVLGTLQAGYTDLPFLGSVTEEIVKKEALIGVSIAGWMNSPELFNEEILKKGAEIVKQANEEISLIIGINPAARMLCTKPDGNCQSFSGKVKTEKGIMTLQQIFDYCLDEVYDPSKYKSNTFLDVKTPLKVYDENNELKSIISLYNNDKVEVYEIEFEDGEKYEFTKDHKLKTTNGWKRVEDLTENDDIIHF